MSKSESLMQRATQVIPGGVNSPVRAFNGVGGSPLFFERGEGACLLTCMANPILIMLGHGVL